MAVLIINTFHFSQQSIEYTVVDIGTFGAESYATGINSKGHIIGYSRITQQDQWRAFIWINSMLTDLGSLGNDDTWAKAINDSDEVTGESYTFSDDIHAFRWKNGIMTDEGTLGGTDSRGYAINNSGVIVGESMITGNIRYTAYQSLNGSMQNLNINPENRASAESINNLGQITGWKILPNGDSDGWLLDNGITLLGSFGGGTTLTRDINDNGQIVGWSYTSTLIPHAFIWENGVMTDLGGVPPGNHSYAYSINSSGEVVGGTPAFIYKDGEMKNLNDLIDPTSGWNLVQANCINDNGWIVGNGIIN